MSFLSAGQDNDSIQRQMTADQIKVAMQQTGAAYSNKRQTDRDFYGNALGNQAASYQGAMNMLGSSGGGTPNLGGLDRQSNPLTLQGTTVGATKGSNSTGYQDISPGSAPDGTPFLGAYHSGIQDYLSGTPNVQSPNATPAYNFADTSPNGQAMNTRNGTNGSINAQLGPGQSSAAPMWQGPPPQAPGQNFNFRPQGQ